MKKHYFIITIITLVLCLILTFNCKKEEEETVLSDKTKLPEENTDLTNVLVNEDTLHLIYKSGATKPQFDSGDILIGQIGDGYLKKVVSTITRGDTLIVYAEQASLTDAIEKCDVETTFVLSPDTLKMGSIQKDTFFIGKDGKKYQLLTLVKEAYVQLSPDGRLFEKRFLDVMIRIEDNNQNIVAYLSCDTIIFKKSIDIDLGLKISLFEIEEFWTIANSSDTVEFKGVRFGLEWSIIDEEVVQKLITIPLGKIVIMAGPVPIVFVFELGVYVGLKADLSLITSCELINNVHASLENSVGARYKDNSWESVWENTLDGNADFNFGPSASIDAELQGFLKGSLDSKLYGVAGPYIYLKPYQYNELTYPPFDYELGIGASAGLGFKVEILSWNLVDYYKELVDYQKMLIQSDTPPNHPPNIPSTPTGSDSGQVGISYNFTTSTTDPDGDDICYIFDWGEGRYDTSAFYPSGESLTMSHSWSSANTYSVKVIARDIMGAISDWSSEHQIIIYGGGGEYPDSVVVAIPVGNFPEGVCALPNNNYVYVVNSGDNNVSVINTTTNSVVKSIPVGNSPEAITSDPSGDFVWVTNAQDNNVSVIRTSDDSVIRTIPVGSRPEGVVVLPTNDYVYVTNRFSDNVSKIRVSDYIVVNTINLDLSPDYIAYHTNGNYVYVSGENTVTVIQTSNDSIIRRISVGMGPNLLSTLPDGNFVYVPCYHSDNIYVIETSTNTVSTIIDVGHNPAGIIPLPNSQFVYVTNSGDNNVSVIRTSDNTIVTTITLGLDPYYGACLPNGDFVYIANYYSNNVSVIGR